MKYLIALIVTLITFVTLTYIGFHDITIGWFSCFAWHFIIDIYNIKEKKKKIEESL